MTSRDELLDGAVHRLREASNPNADDRARILAAVERLGNGPVLPAARERALLPGPTATVGAGARSGLTRALFGWGFALGLAAFGLGFGVGRGSVIVPPRTPDPTTGPSAPAPTLPALAMPAPTLPAPTLPLPTLPLPTMPAPTGATAQPLAAPGSRSEARSEMPPDVSSEMRREAAPSRPVRPVTSDRTTKPRSPSRAHPRRVVAAAPVAALSLADALQLLARAERALYSGNAAWALSLLDELDRRAPSALLHEERIATRILAWCADGQRESAQRLASQARKEAPSSIYGSIIENPCNGEENAQSIGP